MKRQFTKVRYVESQNMVFLEFNIGEDEYKIKKRLNPSDDFKRLLQSQKNHMSDLSGIPETWFADDFVVRSVSMKHASVGEGDEQVDKIEMVCSGFKKIEGLKRPQLLSSPLAEPIYERELGFLLQECESICEMDTVGFKQTQLDLFGASEAPEAPEAGEGAEDDGGNVVTLGETG